MTAEPRGPRQREGDQLDMDSARLRAGVDPGAAWASEFVVERDGGGEADEAQDALTLAL